MYFEGFIKFNVTFQRTDILLSLLITLDPCAGDLCETEEICSETKTNYISHYYDYYDLTGTIPYEGERCYDCKN